MMRLSARSIRHLAALAGATLALGASACGEDETFTAEEFVDTINSGGVELTLGAPLFSDDESTHVFGVELEPLPGAPTPAEGAVQHAHGSLSEHDDISGADEQFQHCKESADLLCFQAANVVIVLEGGGVEVTRLAIAMKKLEE